MEEYLAKQDQNRPSLRNPADSVTMDALKDGSIALEELNKTCVLHYHCTSKVVCHIRNVSVFKIRRVLQFQDYSSTNGFFMNVPLLKMDLASNGLQQPHSYSDVDMWIEFSTKQATVAQNKSKAFPCCRHCFLQRPVFLFYVLPGTIRKHTASA